MRLSSKCFQKLAKRRQEKDSAKSLSETILMLLTHLELQNQIARQAREDMEEYTWNKRASEIIGFLKK